MIEKEKSSDNHQPRQVTDRADRLLSARKKSLARDTVRHTCIGDVHTWRLSGCSLSVLESLEVAMGLQRSCNGVSEAACCLVSGSLAARCGSIRFVCLASLSIFRCVFLILNLISCFRALGSPCSATTYENTKIPKYSHRPQAVCMSHHTPGHLVVFVCICHRNHKQVHDTRTDAVSKHRSETRGAERAG